MWTIYVVLTVVCLKGFVYSKSLLISEVLFVPDRLYMCILARLVKNN